MSAPIAHLFGDDLLDRLGRVDPMRAAGRPQRLDLNKVAEDEGLACWQPCRNRSSSCSQPV